MDPHHLVSSWLPPVASIRCFLGSWMTNLLFLDSLTRVSLSVGVQKSGHQRGQSVKVGRAQRFVSDDCFRSRPGSTLGRGAVSRLG